MPAIEEPSEPFSIEHVATSAGYGVDGRYYPPQPKAWRIRVWYGGVWRACLTAFAREKDASAALNALRAAGITTPEQMAQTPSQERHRIMCEALAW